MTSVRHLLASAFFGTYSHLIAIIGLIVTVASWVVPLDTHAAVSLLTVVRWSVPVLIVVSVLVVTLTYALVQGRRLSQLPRVLHARPQSDDSAILLLLDKSELFGHDAVVSVYHVDGSDFEQLIGVGYVRNIQENGKIQVLVEEVIANGDLLNRLAHNDAEVLGRIRVKPSAPHREMQ